MGGIRKDRDEEGHLEEKDTHRGEKGFQAQRETRDRASWATAAHLVLLKLGEHARESQRMRQVEAPAAWPGMLAAGWGGVAEFSRQMRTLGSF